MIADPWPMCSPCTEVPPRHDDCQGAHVWCSCLAELLMEAEETDDAGNDR